MSPSSPLDFTIAHCIDDIDLLDHLREYLREHPDETIITNRSHLESAIGRSISRPDAERIFTGLVLNDVAEENKSTGSYFADYDFSIKTQLASRILHEQAVARMAIDEMSEHNTSGTRSEMQLAATFPPHLDFSGTVDVVPIADELRQLFFDADNLLRIANPYFDVDPTVIGDIASLPSREVECRLLTRETVDGTQGITRSLNGIYKAIPEERRRLFRVRDLFERDSETGRQAFATHAKVAIADENLCYIGSANLTETSLSTNFEMGVLIRGDIVKDVVRIFDQIFAGGRPVDLPL